MQCRVIPYEGTEPYIFVSYCHKDSEFIYPIMEEMAREGYRIWYDAGNHVGDDWTENIANHLKNARICIAILSKNSSVSHNCKNEVNFALEMQIKLIAVLWGSFAMPMGMRMQISSIHHIKTTDYSCVEDFLRKLLEAPDINACKGTEILLWAEQLTSSPPVSSVVSDEKVPVPIQTASSLEEGMVRSEKVDPADTCLPSYQNHPEKPQVPKIGGDQFQDDAQTIRECAPKRSDDDGATQLENAAGMAVIVIPEKQAIVPISGMYVKIGRSAKQCDVLIENETISKHHADIIQVRGIYHLKAAGSANGTVFNGKRLSSDDDVVLESPAVFLLNKTLAIFVSDENAREIQIENRAVFLVNSTTTCCVPVLNTTVFLNRDIQNRWPDGTLNDMRIHRNSHANVFSDKNGTFIVEAAPQGGNATYVNGKPMQKEEVRKLSHGDRIKLGNTELQVVIVDCT